ncbi:MAG TPA: hypothetical protein VFZ00_30545, partial [Solirubrobacter sp.]|nr:hypothetical protein [Solirubrobacter sp.]
YSLAESTTAAKELRKMQKLFQYGGIAASIVLIAFGIGSIYMGFDGRDRVRDDLAREQIVGTEDSTIPGQKVDTGSEAQAFANVIRKHTLEATGGKTYAQMGRYLDAQGNDTSDESKAAIDEKTGKPVENGLRNMWINATALTTALNTAYFAESVATFAIVMGVALLLAGIGFGVLSLRALTPAATREGSPAQADPAAVAHA